jgi:hypothetical protein
MATNAAVRRPLPDNYETMYPSRFMKGKGFKGKRLLFTIKAIFGEDLLSSEDEATKQEWVTQFEETRLEWVMNKTNAYCLFRMFGGDPHSWVGRRIVLYAVSGVWFGEKAEAIRVFGSPDIAEDLPITLRFLRKKVDRNMTMKRVADPKTKAAPQQAPEPVAHTQRTLPPRALEILPLLGWGPDVTQRWIEVNANLSDDDLVAKLEALLDSDA